LIHLFPKQVFIEISFFPSSFQITIFN